MLNPLRTAVPFWGQSGQIMSSSSSKRDCGTKRVEFLSEAGVLRYITVNYCRGGGGVLFTLSFVQKIGPKKISLLSSVHWVFPCMSAYISSIIFLRGRMWSCKQLCKKATCKQHVRAQASKQPLQAASASTGGQHLQKNICRHRPPAIYLCRYRNYL